MSMLFRQIKVSEVNKFLNEVSSELSDKFGGVSSPEFEQELESRTGIKWKQLKNYRNHPNPEQIIRPNSKIKTFIYAHRRAALIKKVRNPKAWILVFTISSVLIPLTFGIYKRFKLNTVATQGVSQVAKSVVRDPKLKFEIPELNLKLKLGIIDSALLNYKWTFKSTAGDVQTFMFSQTGSDLKQMLSVVLRVKKNDIFGVQITTGSLELAETLKKQLKSQVNSSFKHDELHHSWKGFGETVQTGEVIVPNANPKTNKNQLFIVDLTHDYN